jgi:hypothetical protein
MSETTIKRDEHKIHTPPKRIMPYKKPDLVGGINGNEFDDMFGFTGSGVDVNISSLQVAHGGASNGTLDRLYVKYEQLGQTLRWHGDSDGGTKGPEWTIDVGNGERLVWIEVWLHVFSGIAELNGLRCTKTVPGRAPVTSPILGDTTLSTYDGTTLDARAQGTICCLWGKSGLFVDALGIWIRPPGE